jgi:cytochrome P450
LKLLNIRYLVKANLTSDPDNRLPEESLFDQCATFLLAGSDTVSLALAWCIRYLSLHPEIQTRLREEILSLPMTPPPPISAQNPLDSKSFDIDIGTNLLNSPVSPPPSYPTPSHTPQEHYAAIEELPYLDAVIRETLRFCPPVHGTIRVAAADDQIPISHPIVLQDGTIMDKGESISIRKGSYIHIPIEGLNLCEEIWGSNARQFKYAPPVIHMFDEM